MAVLGTLTCSVGAEPLWGPTVASSSQLFLAASRGSERRDKVTVIRDILVYLAINGPTPRSRIVRELGLSKRAARELLDGFLLERGFLRATGEGTLLLYSVTMQGLAYLTAVLLALPESWPPLSLLASVVEELRSMGIKADTGGHLEDGISVRIPSDLVLNGYHGFVGFNLVQGLSRYYLACLAAKLTGAPVLVALPEQVLEAARGIGLGRCRAKAYIMFHDGSVKSAALALAKGLDRLESGAANASLLEKPRRVVRLG